MKEMAKALERHNSIFGTITYENKGNNEKRNMEGHRLNVRRKMKENDGKWRKTKKIETSLIKIFMRINGKDLISLVWEL